MPLLLLYFREKPAFRRIWTIFLPSSKTSAGSAQNTTTAPWGLQSFNLFQHSLGRCLGHALGPGTGTSRCLAWLNPGVGNSPFPVFGMAESRCWEQPIPRVCTAHSRCLAQANPGVGNSPLPVLGTAESQTPAQPNPGVQHSPFPVFGTADFSVFGPAPVFGSSHSRVPDTAPGIDHE